MLGSMSSRHRPVLSALVVLAALLVGCSSATPAGTEPADEGDAEATPAADVETTEAAAARAAEREAAEHASRAEEERAAARAAAEAEAEAERRAEEARREAEEQARRERARTEQVQEVLAANGYYAGPIDGEAGPETSSAVMAFQKVHGLARDGAIGPQTLAAIESPESPPLVGGAATRVEVDLDRQVVHLVEDGARVRTMNASSGNGEVYTWPDGRRARADTPVGTFVIERRIDGLREGDLGAMYDPMYFHQGWALHGSNHVPAYPASHGCVRLSRSDARWLGAQVPNGTQVVVHGSTNAFAPDTETVWL